VATAAIAGIAAWVSYWHMVGVAAHYGETEAAASYLLPLSVDGLVIVASVSLVEISGRIRADIDRQAAALTSPRADDPAPRRRKSSSSATNPAKAAGPAPSDPWSWPCPTPRARSASPGEWAPASPPPCCTTCR
jgi:hypothetical protein